MESIRDERTDEIIVSTFPGERSGWLRRDLVGRLARESGLPVEHVVVDPAELGAPGDRVTPPPPRPPRARRSPTAARGSTRATLGMFLFIASEAMLFGSFFAVYFFDRVS